METSLSTPQGTGAMTLEQGIAHVKATLAKTGANVSDQAAIVDDDALPEGETEGGNVADFENTGGGSEMESPPADEASPDDAQQLQDEDRQADGGKILLPDGGAITVEEARKGYLRQGDYTRKTQDLARERDTLAAEKQAAIAHLGGLYQQLASLQEPEPDWLQLARHRTPAEFQQIQAYWRHKNAVLGQTREVALQHQDQAIRVAKAKAFEVLSVGEYEPAWKDAKALQSGLDKVATYLTETYGMGADVIAGITDPEVIVIADKARRYDELQRAKPKAALAVKGKPLPFRPGAKSAASPQSENIRLLSEAFHKNPTVDNAVALQRAKAARR